MLTSEVHSQQDGPPLPGPLLPRREEKERGRLRSKNSFTQPPPAVPATRFDVQRPGAAKREFDELMREIHSLRERARACSGEK